VNYVSRRIFKTQLTGPATLKELLQTMFASEMLVTGARIWVVSPWVTNVALLDNRSGNFDALNPEWGHREVRVAEILSFLMTRGNQVVVVTRDLDINKGLITALEDEVRRLDLQDQLSIILREQLHSKGILLSRSMLLGSMNLTYSGIEINDESVEFVIDPEDIARTRLEYNLYLPRAS
jgi:phosphatidylserine/phosphatidylglycerophosphate/cardiolipin synthase-like enzyme